MISLGVVVMIVAFVGLFVLYIVELMHHDNTKEELERAKAEVVAMRKTIASYEYASKAKKVSIK